MVFCPAVPIPGAKPVAVYLDGWQFHEHTVPEDLALRQKIVRSGKVLVWSATWDDVVAPAEVGKPRHYWEPQPNLDERIQKLADGDACPADAQAYVDMAPFDQFLAFLGESDLSKWTMRARTIATSWFLQGMKPSPNGAAITALVEELAGPEARITLADTELDTLCAHLATASCGVVSVAASKSWRPPVWPELGDLTAVVGFEHRLAKSSEAKRAWSGALRLMNFLQFPPYFYVGCAQSVGPEAALRPAEAPVVDLWRDVGDVVLSDLQPVVQELRRRGAPTPEALYEAAGTDGDVFGTFEIA
jgi:DEAD/DEAH box helicase domain-containing protein